MKAISSRKNVPMSEYCTFRTGGKAELFYEPASANEIIQVIKKLRMDMTPFCVIGKGSNILVSDSGYKGAVIHIGENFSEIKLLPDNRIYAQSGATLFSVACFAMSSSLKGLEFASGIPGSLGGGIAMNAGAYGGQLSDILESVDLLTPEYDIITVSVKDMDMSYRHSRVQDDRSIVLGATFALEEGNRNEIQSEIKQLNARRAEKQPLNYPSAGSVFKRPEGYYAGTLIEECGLKGTKIGGAEVSQKHAGFIINSDNATSKDIYDLIKFVQKTVLEKKGVSLSPEIRFIGVFK